MTSQTKTRGGARPGNPNGLRGGARQNTGLVQRLEMSKPDAQTLRTLLLARYGKANKETANMWLANVIRQEWTEYDTTIQAQAAELAEVE